MRSSRGSRPVKKYTRGGGSDVEEGTTIGGGNTDDRVVWGKFMGERRKPQGGDTRTRIDFYISFLA